MIMRLLATLLLLLLATTATHAADPAQPKVGPTTVINATNGYGGVLTVRTQLNVGYAGQQGYVDIQSTNGTYTTTLTVDASGYTDMVNTGTNVVQVGQRGELFVGNQGVPEWGGLSQLTVENDVSTGDPVLQRVNFESIGDSGLADYAGSYFKADSTTTAVYSQLLMEAKEADTTSDATLTMQAGHGTGLYLRMDESGTTLVMMAPGVGSGATPYVYDTGVAHVGGNLVEWSNNGTLKGDLTFNGLWEGRAFQATDGSNSGIYYGGYTELSKPDSLYTLNDIALDTSNGDPSFVMFSTGETLGTLPYVNLKPARLGTSWSLGEVPFTFNTRTNIAAGNIIFGIGNNNTNDFAVSHSTTADDTVLMLWDVTAGSLVRVSRGASDSGGAGFRVLRIPN